MSTDGTYQKIEQAPRIISRDLSGRPTRGHPLYYRRIWPENWVDGGGLGITIRNEPWETVLGPSARAQQCIPQ